MSAARHSQRELIAQINQLFEGEGLTLCTVADQHGVPDLGCHFLLRTGTNEIAEAHVCIATLARQFGLIRFPAEIGA